MAEVTSPPEARSARMFLLWSEKPISRKDASCVSNRCSGGWTGAAGVVVDGVVDVAFAPKVSIAKGDPSLIKRGQVRKRCCLVRLLICNKLGGNVSEL